MYQDKKFMETLDSLENKSFQMTSVRKSKSFMLSRNDKLTSDREIDSVLRQNS